VEHIAPVKGFCGPIESLNKKFFSSSRSPGYLGNHAARLGSDANPKLYRHPSRLRPGIDEEMGLLIKRDPRDHRQLTGTKRGYRQGRLRLMREAWRYSLGIFNNPQMRMSRGGKRAGHPARLVSGERDPLLRERSCRGRSLSRCACRTGRFRIAMR
jgi:hypothetical protein